MTFSVKKWPKKSYDATPRVLADQLLMRVEATIKNIYPDKIYNTTPILLADQTDAMPEQTDAMSEETDAMSEEDNFDTTPCVLGVESGSELAYLLPSSTSDVRAFSSFHEEEICFRWTINNAKCVLRYLTEPLQSPTFTVPKIPNKLFLSVVLFANLPDSLTFVPFNSLTSELTSESSNCHKLQLTLNECPGHHTSITVYASKYSFSILDPLERRTEKSGVDKLFIDDGDLQPISVFISVTKEEFEQILHKDTITVQFKASLTFVTDPIHSVSPCTVVSEHNPNKQMKLMFEDELFTDITIKTGEKTFNAHRVVLASHSDVFKRMFEVDMKEKRQGVVTISDIGPEVMADLLAYMYTGTAPNLKTLAKKLLIAADKYNLPRLLVMCENNLKMNLTPANVADILLVADRLQSETRSTESLKEACIKFIKHCSSVYQSESWKILKETSLKLALETMESIACDTD